MRILRDVREATELLILLEVTTQRHTRMKTLAEKLGMTVQGVSTYLKEMTDRGLVRRSDGAYVATVEGVERLHERFRELRDFVERASEEMRILERVAALAGAAVQEGDRVGLFMEDGFLVAYPDRESSSQGRALHGAEAGEDVTVVDLEGIVELRPGRVTVVRVPGTGAGGTRAADREGARELLEARPAAKVAANDVVAAVLCRKLGVEPDFAFAAVPSALDAARRGLDVVLLASEDTAPEAVASLEAANEGRETRIEYEMVDLQAPGGITTEKAKSRGRET